jgi:hypothetical protein
VKSTAVVGVTVAPVCGGFLVRISGGILAILMEV